MNNKKKLELNMNKINNPTNIVIPTSNSTKSKTIKKDIQTPTMGIKSQTNKAKPKINIQKTCQNIISNINNGLLITTQTQNRNKNLYASGNIDGNHKSSGNFKMGLTGFGNSSTPSNITSSILTETFNQSKKNKSSIDEKQKPQTQQINPQSNEPIMSKKEKLNYLRKLVLSTQKQISLTEKQLKISSNNDNDSQKITFERHERQEKPKIKQETNNIIKPKVQIKENTNFTHKKQTKSDYLSSQITLSINNFLKTKSNNILSLPKQNTPQNKKLSNKDVPVSSEYSNLGPHIHNNNSQLRSIITTDMIIEDKDKKKIKKKEVKNNTKDRKEPILVTKLEEKENDIEISKEGLDLISTIKNVNSILAKANPGGTLNMNNNFNININISGDKLNAKDKSNSSNNLDHSSKLLDKNNKLKRETFVGNIKNKKSNKNIESDLFVTEESNSRIKKYDAIFNFISNNLKEISELVSHSDDKNNQSNNITSELNIKGLNSSENNLKPPSDDGIYLCKNLKMLTDPEYEALLLYKLRENKFMSIESGDSQKNPNVLPKSNFSKELIIPKDRSFIVSSVNDEVYKNLIQIENATSAGMNLSMSSLKSKLNDKTLNQYDDITYTEENSSGDNNIKNLKFNQGSKKSLEYIQRKVATEIELDDDQKLEIIEKREQNCLIF